MLKNAVWKLMKNFKTFKKIRIFNHQLSKMIKLIKNINNSKIFWKFWLNEKLIQNFFRVNNRIDNMIKIMKKMTLNVNVFINDVAQQQKHQIRYFQFSSRNSFMQIVRCSDVENQQIDFFFELKINNLQNFAFETAFYQ